MLQQQQKQRHRCVAAPKSVDSPLVGVRGREFRFLTLIPRWNREVGTRASKRASEPVRNATGTWRFSLSLSCRWWAHKPISREGKEKRTERRCCATLFQIYRRRCRWKSRTNREEDYRRILVGRWLARKVGCRRGIWMCNGLEGICQEWERGMFLGLSTMSGGRQVFIIDRSMDLVDLWVLSWRERISSV